MPTFEIWGGGGGEAKALSKMLRLPTEHLRWLRVSGFAVWGLGFRVGGWGGRGGGGRGSTGVMKMHIEREAYIQSVDGRKASVGNAI